MTWYPKKDSPRNWNTRPAPPKIASLELAERLRKEDRDFDRLWRRYWNQRNKWRDFEDFKSNAA